MRNENLQKNEWVSITLTRGGMPINGYTNGQGEFRLNLTQLANLIKKPAKSVSKYLASKTFKVEWVEAPTDIEPVIKLASPTGGWRSLVHTEAAKLYILHQAKLQNPEAYDVALLFIKASWEIPIQNPTEPIPTAKVAKLQGQTPEWLTERVERIERAIAEVGDTPSARNLTNHLRALQKQLIKARGN